MDKSLNYFKSGSKVPAIDTIRYLLRLHLIIEPPSVRYLKRIIHAHIMNIPFENLDLFYQKETKLEIKHLFEKIVINQRGGINFELNILLYHLLANLGFECMLIGCHRFLNETYSKDWDHCAVLVRIDGHDWLCDVSYPTLLRYPIKMITNHQVQLDYTSYYKFEESEEWMIFRRSTNQVHFYAQYRFQLIRRDPIEFLPRIIMMLRPNESWLSQDKLLYQNHPSGYAQLVGNHLKIKKEGKAQEYFLLNEDEFIRKTKEHFHLNVDSLLYSF